MRYPEFIKKGDTIAVTAPSAGIVDENKLLRLDNAKRNIEKIGYKYIETNNVRKDINGRSSSAKERAEQFMELWNNNNVSAIIAASGGDFLLEILNYLDFDKISKQEPKWLQGYSDITGLGFLLTSYADIATIYGENIKAFGMKKWYNNLEDSFYIMEGKKFIQESFEYHEPNFNEFKEDKTPYEEYCLTIPTIWKNLNGERNIKFSGRSIGGCFDVIVNIIGTKFDKINQYIEKYKADGIIWFFDVFEMSSPQVLLHLWQMKNAGYFKYCNGILFGRPLMIREDYNMKFEDAIKEALKELNIPIIFDVDIGHVAPQMPIVNGAILDIIFKDGKGAIKTNMI